MDAAGTLGIAPEAVCFQYEGKIRFVLIIPILPG